MLYRQQRVRKGVSQDHCAGPALDLKNGFGAYTNVIYACELNSDDKTVIDARP
jgi:hypothetical protein